MQFENQEEFEAKFNRATNAATNLAVELLCDLKQAKYHLEELDNQFYRRAFCKAFLSYIEGTANGFREIVLILLAAEGADPTEKEKWFLTERKDKIADDGVIVSIPHFAPILESLTYLIEEFSSLRFGDFEFDKKDENWFGLTQALKIRNRITHPKDVIDLHISDKELESLKRSSEWFCNLIYQIHIDSVRNLFRTMFALKRNVILHGIIKPETENDISDLEELRDKCQSEDINSLIKEAARHL